MITIETARFSTVVKAFLERYPSATVLINKKTPNEDVAIWCTNSRLKSTIDFSIVENGVELLGFHDNPYNMWASSDALSLIETLNDSKILKFKIHTKKDNKSIFSKIFNQLRA